MMVLILFFSLAGLIWRQKNGKQRESRQRSGFNDSNTKVDVGHYESNFYTKELN